MKENQKLVIIILSIALAIMTAVAFRDFLTIDDDSWLTGKVWKQRTDQASWDMMFFSDGTFYVYDQAGILESSGQWRITGDIMYVTVSGERMVSYYAYKSFSNYDMLILDSHLDHQDVDFFYWSESE